MAKQKEEVKGVDPENVFLKEFYKGSVPYHTRCGSICDYLSEARGADIFWFGVSCPKCLRNLMEGEVHYAASK